MNKIEEARDSMSAKQEKYLTSFANNLNEGISYYHKLFSNMEYGFNTKKFEVLSELYSENENLDALNSKIEKIKVLKKKPVLV